MSNFQFYLILEMLWLVAYLSSESGVVRAISFVAMLACGAAAIWG